MMEFADIIFYLDLFFWEICFEIGIIHKQIIEHIYICNLSRYLSRDQLVEAEIEVAKVANNCCFNHS